MEVFLKPKAKIEYLPRINCLFSVIFIPLSKIR